MPAAGCAGNGPPSRPGRPPAVIREQRRTVLRKGRKTGRKSGGQRCRLAVRMPEDHAAGRPAGDDGAVASGRLAEADARKDGLLSQHFHPGEAGAPEHGGILFALHEHGHRLVQRRAHAAVVGHVDMVGMHMGHDIGIHTGQDVGHRHGQVAQGHGQVQPFGAAAEHGIVAERPHAAPGRQPGVGEEGLAGVADADHGVADLLYLHLGHLSGMLLRSPGIRRERYQGRRGRARSRAKKCVPFS